MVDASQVELLVVGKISDIGQLDWDACACPEGKTDRSIDPFVTYRFLKGLEDSKSVGSGTGWLPQYIVAKYENQTIGVMPSYAKGHSQGEYIFDHNWAHAYENAGGKYYPKLQISIPFTPVTGRRFLTKPDFHDIAETALLEALKIVVTQQKWSSGHITFCSAEEFKKGNDLGLLQRIGQQFHWVNNNYQNFDEFLAQLSSRKRKNIKKERKIAENFGGTFHQFTGDEITHEHWEAFWSFYIDTGARKWGTPYLTREFFNYAHEMLRNDIVLFLCQKNGKWIAGALNFIGRDTLFGRYWGCIENYPCLHFEVCYYLAIEFAIKNNLSRVEAGAQGEHKLARGYLPVPTYSLHWFENKGFSNAVEEYLIAERKAVGDDIEVLTDYGPFRKTLED
ncbi:GNAT family N-acetyltransferase [Amylibacter sp.]|jgi:hypothetical protein|nr:GNAT family N-acetyltransferase [Amylibacter sp.]MDB4125320.1 GNAT family N-acetyltransferase [Amylibacter sp.]MDB4248664.1 GNAT family N-acetyltransferase [Amylibacter sp.]MDC1499119.1 GNAT family N-acetyltransferase [Amylibacter sp.]